MTLSRRFVPQRDVQATGFTAVLRRLVTDVPGLQAAAFCDEMGETVDYHSYLEPFDVKVAGAVLQLLIALVDRECPKLSSLGVQDLLIQTPDHVLFARRLPGAYILAGVLAGDGLVGRLLTALDTAEANILNEAGL